MNHLILVTYGEPLEPRFLAHLAYSWRILLGLTRSIAPIPRPVLPVIALSRAWQRTRTWMRERYQSPLEAITWRQADAVRAALQAVDPRGAWHTHVAYEFRRPRLTEVLARIPADEPVIVAPLYAADSDFTHGLSRTVVAAQAHTRLIRGLVGVLPALDPDRLAAVAATHVRERLADRPDWRGPDVALVLAAHGTLLEPVRPIDTGLAATGALCRAIRSHLATDFGLIVNGWLNHTMGGRWTTPPVDEALRQVADAGFRRVVYYPYGFLADNAESQLEGRLALRGEPRLEALHLDCLNASTALAELLAAQIAGTPRPSPGGASRRPMSP